MALVIDRSEMHKKDKSLAIAATAAIAAIIIANLAVTTFHISSPVTARFAIIIAAIAAIARALSFLRISDL